MVNNSKRPILQLELLSKTVDCKASGEVVFTVKELRQVPAKGRENFKFGVHLFGPSEDVIVKKLGLKSF